MIGSIIERPTVAPPSSSSARAKAKGGFPLPFVLSQQQASESPSAAHASQAQGSQVSADAQDKQSIQASVSAQDRQSIQPSISAQDRQSIQPSMTVQERQSIQPSISAQDRQSIQPSISAQDRQSIQPSITVQERQSISRESDAILASMSERDILQAQRELQAKLGEGVLDMLRKRGVRAGYQHQQLKQQPRTTSETTAQVSTQTTAQASPQTQQQSQSQSQSQQPSKHAASPPIPAQSLKTESSKTEAPPKKVSFAAGLSASASTSTTTSSLSAPPQAPSTSTSSPSAPSQTPSTSTSTSTSTSQIPLPAQSTFSTQRTPPGRPPSYNPSSTPPLSELLQLSLSTSVPQRAYALRALVDVGKLDADIVLRFRSNLAHSVLTLRVLALDGLVAVFSRHCSEVSSGRFRNSGLVPSMTEELAVLKADIFRDPVLALIAHTKLLKEINKLILDPHTIAGALKLLHFCAWTSRDACEEIVRVVSLPVLISATITDHPWPSSLIHARGALDLILVLVQSSRGNAQAMMDKSCISAIWRFVLVPQELALTALTLRILAAIGRYGLSAREVCTYWAELAKLPSSPELADVLDVFISLSRYPHQTSPLHAIKWTLANTALHAFSHVDGLNWRAAWAEGLAQYKDNNGNSQSSIPDSLTKLCDVDVAIECCRSLNYSAAMSFQRLSLLCLSSDQISSASSKLIASLEDVISSESQIVDSALAELLFSLYPKVDIFRLMPRLSKGSEHVALQCLEIVCPREVLSLYTSSVYPARKTLQPRYLVCAQSLVLAETQILDLPVSMVGLPFHPLWAIHVPINELLKPAGTSESLKTLQLVTEHRPTEIDLINVALNLLKDCCDHVHTSWTHSVLAVMRILSLELDVNDQSSTEIYNEDRINSTLIGMTRGEFANMKEEQLSLEHEGAVFLSKGVPFYQLYTDLCGMAGSAFPNAVFNVMLIPTSMKYAKDYRLLIWSDYLTVWRGITVAWTDLCPKQFAKAQVDWLGQEETDESVLKAYLKALVSETIKRNDEFFYRVAVHHIHRAVSSKSSLIDAMKKQLVSAVLSNVSSDALKDIISYDGSSFSSAPSCYESLVERQAMIAHLEAWIGASVKTRLAALFRDQS